MEFKRICTIYIATVSMELAEAAMFLQWRSERRRYRNMILRQQESEEQRLAAKVSQKKSD